MLSPSNHVNAVSAEKKPNRREPRPAFQLYAADELSDAAEMTLEELGARSVLRSHAWREGSVPAGHAALARILRVSVEKVAEMWPALSRSLAPGDADRLVFPELETLRDKYQEHSAKRAAAANAKWDAYRAAENASADASAEHEHMQMECSVSVSPSSSVSPSPTTTLSITDYREDPAAGAANPLGEVNPPIDGLIEPKKKPKRADLPLPYTADRLLDALATAACGRFVSGKLTRGQSIAVQKQIREYSLGDVRMAGEWLASGGDGWRGTLDVRHLKDLPAWIAQADAWNTNGRPDIETKPGKQSVRPAIMTAANVPAGEVKW